MLFLFVLNSNQIRHYVAMYVLTVIHQLIQLNVLPRQTRNVLYDKFFLLLKKTVFFFFQKQVSSVALVARVVNRGCTALCTEGDVSVTGVSYKNYCCTGSNCNFSSKISARFENFMVPIFFFGFYFLNY